MKRSRVILAISAAAVVALIATVAIVLYRQSSAAQQQRKLDLLIISNRLDMFRIGYSRWPRDAAELATMKLTESWPPGHETRDEEAVRRMVEGKYRPVPRIKRHPKFDLNPPAELLIAYEARVDQGDGLAIFGDGEVRKITAAQLKEHLERAIAIQADAPAWEGKSK